MTSFAIIFSDRSSCFLDFLCNVLIHQVWEIFQYFSHSLGTSLEQSGISIQLDLLYKFLRRNLVIWCSYLCLASISLVFFFEQSCTSTWTCKRLMPPCRQNVCYFWTKNALFSGTHAFTFQLYKCSALHPLPHPTPIESSHDCYVTTTACIQLFQGTYKPLI